MNKDLPRASEFDGRTIWEIRASYREIIVKSLGDIINMMSAPIPRDHTFLTVACNCASVCYHVMAMLLRDISAKDLDKFASTSEAAEYVVSQLADASIDREHIVRVADAASYIAFEALMQTQEEHSDWFHKQGVADLIDGDFPFRRFLSPPVDEAVAGADSAKTDDGLSTEDVSDVSE